METEKVAERETGRKSTRSRRLALTDISNADNDTAPVQAKTVTKRRLSRNAVPVVEEMRSHDDAQLDKRHKADHSARPSTSSNADQTAAPSSSSSYSAGRGSSSRTLPQTAAPSLKAAPLPKFVPPQRLSTNPDPAKCPEIIDSLYELYYEQEEKYRVLPYIATMQREITAKMRCILVDWLVEVHYKFKLMPQTLWMCIGILDRYLQQMHVGKTKLQLVGVSALLLACKFEESGPPEVKDCIFITDNAYSRAEILAMERSILETLNYDLCVPTAYHFLVKYLQTVSPTRSSGTAAAPVPTPQQERLRNIAFYYAERNLQEYDVLDHKPHMLAAACLYAALLQQQQTDITKAFVLEEEIEKTGACPPQDVWTAALVQETRATEAELIPIAKTIVEHVAEEPSAATRRLLIAARKKYNLEKHCYVSNLLLPQINDK